MSRRILPALALLFACESFHGEELSAAPAPALSGTTAEGDFELTSLRGRVVLLTFGYTSCPDVCPTTLSTARRAFSLLGDDASRATLAFVSLDPARDAPDRLGRYVEAFDPRFVGVQLTPRAIAALADSWGVRSRIRPGGASGYVVDHTPGFFVVDRAGKLRLRFALDTNPEALAADLKTLVHEGDA